MLNVDTPLGNTLGKPRIKVWLAMGVALAAISPDFCLTSFRVRALTTIASVLMLGLLARGDRVSLGLVVRPRPSYQYWVKVTLGIGAIVGGFFIISALILWLIGIHIQIPATPPEHIMSALKSYCIFAPLHEEALYRLIVCLPLLRIAGPQWTIFVSGAIFAAVHFVRGNPSPENFIGGYFLAWAFLKSGSILTPIVLHSLGNASVVALHVANWYKI